MICNASSRITVRFFLAAFCAFLIGQSSPEETSASSARKSDVSDGDFMLEDCNVVRIWDMLLHGGGGREKVGFTVVAACIVASCAFLSIFSRRRCISKRNSNLEVGSAPAGVCSSDIDMSLDEVLVDRLWGMLLQVEVGVITDCLMVAIV